MCEISGSVLSLSDDNNDDDEALVLCIEFDEMESSSIFLVVPNMIGNLYCCCICGCCCSYDLRRLGVVNYQKLRER